MNRSEFFSRLTRVVCNVSTSKPNNHSEIWSRTVKVGRSLGFKIDPNKSLHEDKFLSTIITLVKKQIHCKPPETLFDFGMNLSLYEESWEAYQKTLVPEVVVLPPDGFAG